jgi:hypothetical protein
VRRLPYLSFFAALAATAHVVNFEFVAPKGAGNRVADGGTTVLQWVDGPDVPDVARVTLFAAYGSLSPFFNGNGAFLTRLTPFELRINDPANIYTWDTSDLGPGCYQPVAVLRDPAEGVVRAITAQGTISVGEASRMPSSVWLTTPADAQPDDAGILSLRATVDIPQGTAELTVTLMQDGLDLNTSAPIPLTPAVHEVTFALDTKRAPPGFSFVRVNIQGGDENSGLFCYAYWSGYIGSGPVPDGGFAFDGGYPFDFDAGMGEMGGNGFGRVADPQGVPLWGGGGACGCGSTGAAGLGLLGLLFTKRRRALARTSPPAGSCL